ncbi:aspartyl protease family protein [Confluentibacter flavum]|uniref:Signaling protein n=1 Tax=Confluentibacter flavum TaxID=1909700 RepID=A0A2N3HG85_9FLAO|nr:aspartyl protease family protein [Confluentibacter flavum]PKQ43987.1 signaling protein [Confluentibacter flavum]
MKKLPCIILSFLCFVIGSYSQDKFSVQNKHKSDKVKFSLINNVIIIPVEINGVTLSFLLDTGVSKPMIFNFLNVSDTLKVKNTEAIFLKGLGGGDSVEALKSTNNVLRIGDAINLHQDLYAIFNTNLNFAPKLGIPVHGIIGYDIFKDLIVEINYSKKYLKLTEPNAYKYKKCKKCETFNLEFYNNKPYLNGTVTINNKTIPVKLLIDSGGSDALWLFENDSLGIVTTGKYFDDFLGHGLSGSVYGKRSKIETFSLKHFEFKEANVAFPDAVSISIATQFKDRNGSVSGNILKRFNIIMDYGNTKITLKKNANFNNKFAYNRSGIELAHDGVRFVKEIDNSTLNDNRIGNEAASEYGNRIVFDNAYKISLKPSYSIVELRKGSPADRAGLKVNDIILSINGKPTHNLSLQDLTHMFYDDIGKRIKLKIDRAGVEKLYEFNLEDVFK